MAERTCIIEGCDKTNIAAKGWCWMHYRRWLRYGAPELVTRTYRFHSGSHGGHGDQCGVEDCHKPTHTRGWCKMHYARFWRSGSVGEAATRQPGRHLDSAGYVLVRDPSHPLAHSSGFVFEHRAVLYEKLGPDAQPCHWCGVTLVWSDDLCTDHLDSDTTNNDSDNLVPSCRPCNTGRAQRARYVNT